ncbi:MAG: sensor histidine kinase [Anaerolineales bacterium]
MQFIVLLLAYLAVVVRTVAYNYYDDPVPGLLYLLLVVYGLILVSEPAVSRRLSGYRRVYLSLQFALVVIMMLVMPAIDFLPTLLYPLCFQAVMFFGRREGFIWIGAFALSIVYPVMLGWEWQVEGLAIVLLDGVACFLVGSFAHLIRRADAANQANQRLTAELQEAYRKLQDDAARSEELAALQERNRMARELHDSVTQTIFSMNLTVQAARILIDKDLTRCAEQLDRLQELARSAVAEIQALVSQLRPSALASGSLPAALQRLVEERQQRDGLQIALEISGERDFPQSALTSLYRIAQEALNNISKHAGVTQAAVRLHLDSQPAYLEIEDQGRGFEPGSAARDLDHIGLAGMADRARELGWRLEVDSQPGRGTRIRVEEVSEWQTSPALASG